MSLPVMRVQPDRAVGGAVWGTRAFCWPLAACRRFLGGAGGARGGRWGGRVGGPSELLG
jgi:hypothetical protein